MERIYFDSVAFIYYVEQRSPWFARIVKRLSSGTPQVVVSDLTRMECRVKPLADGDTALLTDFDDVFAVAEIAPITSAVFDRATQIRAAPSSRRPTPSISLLRSRSGATCS